MARVILSITINRVPGEFGYIGIRAKAVVVITSRGRGGIADDSTEDYLQAIEAEELQEVRYTLEDFGFRKQAIDKAMDRRVPAPGSEESK